MRTRLRIWFWQYLICLDQLVHVGAVFWTYVLFGRGSPPDADETVSSRVGRAAIKGRAWALVAEHIIDRLFMALGDGPDHCRRSIELADSACRPVVTPDPTTAP